MKMIKYTILLILIVSVGCKNRNAVKQIESPIAIVEAVKASVDSTDSLVQTEQAEMVVQGNGSYFGDERYLLDNYVFSISKNDYESAKNNYHNAIDSMQTIVFQKNCYVLPLSNGDTKILENIDYNSSDDMVTYDYVGEIPSLDSYLLSISKYEGRGYIMISKNNGKVTELREFPYVSHANNNLVTLRTDEEGESYGTIEIFTAKHDNIVFFTGLWSWNILPTEGCWFNNNTLYFIAEYLNENYSQDTRYYKILIDTPVRVPSQPSPSLKP